MTYGLTEQNNTDKFKFFDLFLVLGLTLAPMTGLRVWRIGPAEVLCLIWGIRPLMKRRFRRSDTLSFFALFLVTLSLGAIIGSFVAPMELSVPGMLTWLYLAIIAIGLYEGLSQKSLAYTEKLLRIFSDTAILWYVFLFLYSRTVSRSFLGAPLWYYSRFSGGGTNPHQIAVMLCGLCFVFTRQILQRQKILLNALFVALTVFLLVKTESSTGIMAIFVGFVASIYFYLVNLSPKNRVPVSVVMTLVLLLLGILAYSFLYDHFINWVSKDSNGLGRLEIFASFPASFGRSPILGLGPGTHGVGGTIEFHNSYLEIAVASGIVGFTLFVVYSVRIFKKTLRSDWKLFVILISMYTYSLAGFAMRRLAYWGILIFAVVIAEKKAAELAAGK